MRTSSMPSVAESGRSSTDATPHHPIVSEAHAFAAVVYLALNPVRARITRHLNEWP